MSSTLSQDVGFRDFSQYFQDISGLSLRVNKISSTVSGMWAGRPFVEFSFLRQDIGSLSTASRPFRGVHPASTPCIAAGLSL